MAKKKAKVEHDMKWKTPFADLLPRPTNARLADIKAQLKHDGQRYKAEVDNEGNLLDGHIRYSILGNKLRTVVVNGLKTVDEKRAYVLKRAGETGKNLTADQEKARREQLKAMARKFRDDGYTQERIGALLGVAHSTISRWLVQLHKTGGSDRATRKALTDRQEDEVVARIEEGETQKSIAERFGVSTTLISKIATKRGAKKKPKPVGRIPKTITGRGGHYSALIANSLSVSQAAARCKFSEAQAKRAAKIFREGSDDLKRAVDEELLTIWEGFRLLQKSKAEQQQVIEDAEAQRLEEKTRRCRRDATKIDKVRSLLALLEKTWTMWRGFRDNIKCGKWLRQISPDKAASARRQLSRALIIVQEVGSKLNAELAERKPQ